jgi:hypothetical protein
VAAVVAARKARRAKVMDSSQYIGKEVKFSADPYHYGKGTIESIEPHSFPDHFVVNIVTTEAREISRLFGASRSDEYNGRSLTLYPFTEATLDRAVAGEQTLRHIYPV